MPAVGDFLGTYRILALLSRTPSSELYCAEHTYENSGPVLLIFRPTVALTTTEDRDAFLQKARASTIQRGEQAIALRDAGIANHHPYLVTAFTQEIQNLRSNERHALIEAFLRTFTELGATKGNTISASPGQSEKAGAQRVHQNTTASTRWSPRSVMWKKGQQRWKPNTWQAGIALGLLLALLVWGGSFLYSIIPAATATVTITPVKHEFTQTYHLSVAAETSADPLVVLGRQISSTSQELSQTVAATGQGHEPATSAKGAVVLSQIHLTNFSSNNTLAISSVRDSHGITITTDQEVPISEGATVTIPAHADPSGSGGNIPAYDIDGPIDIVDAITQAHTGTGYLSNPAPFTGGQDARNYTFVQQGDIDKVVTALTTQLTPDTNAKVQEQVRVGEHLAQNPQCTSHSSSNHQANDEAGDVTVTVSVTCSGLVYTDQAIHDTAVKAYTSDGSAKFGSDYDVVGDVVASKPTALSSGDGFSITVDGIWSFQYTPARLQEIKRLIAGKSRQDALQLLSNRKDIQNVTLVISSGIGSAVPTAFENIKLVVVKGTGLQA